MRSPRPEWKILAAVLLVSAGILAIHRSTYWRPFDDTPQESVASFHAYGLAAASTIGLWPNPIAARDVDIGTSRVRPYSHWPNGFFLLLEGMLRIFGRTESAGRWFAIVATLLGLTLIVVSLDRHDVLLYAALPLILLSAAGRDCIPFVFIDAALYVWIGILLWITAHLRESRYYNLTFRAALLAGLCFNHLVLPYAGAIAGLKWLERRSLRDLILDLVMLGSGGALLLLALASSGGNLQSGLAELHRIADYRARYALGVWYRMLNWDLRNSLQLEPITSYVVAAAWLIALAARQWRTCLLLPSFLLFAVLLREYVAEHEFARLPLVFFSVVTLVVGVGVLVDKLAASLQANRPAIAIAQVVIAVALGVRMAAGDMQYRPYSPVQATRESLMRIWNDPEKFEILSRCNAFEFRFQHRQYNPEDRIGQFFFGPQVVERVRRGDPIRRCLVDLADETVHELSPKH